MKWKPASEHPDKPGYYLTYYWSEEREAYLFKAFQFNNGRWWFTRFEPKPICWWDKHFDFYVPCQTQMDVDPVPEEFRANVPIIKAFKHLMDKRSNI